MIYLGCLGGHTFNPADGGILDSDENFKQLEKEALKIICYIMPMNSGDSLEDELIRMTIKSCSTRGDSDGLLDYVTIL